MSVTLYVDVLDGTSRMGLLKGSGASYCLAHRRIEQKRKGSSSQTCKIKSKPRFTLIQGTSEGTERGARHDV